MIDDEDEGSEDRKILDEAKKRFARCEEWEATARERWIEDVRFVNGDPDNGWQWPLDISRNRQLEQRPCLTVNKTRQHCLQIVNDGKQNKPSVNVHPVGDEATYEAAQVFEGIVRHIEYNSNAQAVYDKAMTDQVYGGLGAWRLTREYVSSDTFDQEIFIKPIADPLSIYMDPDAKDPDKSDMRFCFVYEDMPKEVFDEKYPDASTEAFGSPFDENNTWVTRDTIRVAEYFRKKTEKDQLVTMMDAQTGERRFARKSAIPREIWKQIKADPNTKTRDIDVVTIEWFKIAGDTILERGVELGKDIPIIPVIGEEFIVEGEMDRRGHVRTLKDPQRMYNYNTPLALDTPLPTPSGWTTMGEVKGGDWLLDEFGKPVCVLGTSPIFADHKCYRVTFDDGSHIDADAGHLWTVEERGKRKAGGFEWNKAVIGTDQLTPGKHFIYVTEPLELPDAVLPVDPYVLGAWLGDGSAAKSVIHAHFDDAEEMRDILRERGESVGEPRRYSCAGCAEITVFGLQTKLKSAGLFQNKHIPDAYLRASRRQRLELLQGLMDTDGNISKGTRQCSFVNINPRIAAGMKELLRSLGLKANCATIPGEVRKFPNSGLCETQDAVRFSFTAGPDLPVFRLRRKLDAQSAERLVHPRRTKRHRIKSVEEIPSIPVRCVGVDSNSHLFLAGEGMIPTHNSAFVESIGVQTKTPWITPMEAIEGVETYWANANTANYAYLPYKSLTDDGTPIPPPQRQPPPITPEAFVTGLQICQQEMMMASGQYQAQMGENENAKSGKAISERQRQGDNATYHFIDNLAMAIRRTGRILIDWIPQVYDTPRVLRILGEDGERKEVKVDPQAQQAYQEHKTNEENQAEVIFNPNVGQYSVEADVGPAYATKRQEAFNAFSQIAAQNQEIMTVIGDLLFKAADFPGADEVAERLRRLVPPAALGDGPSPQEQQLMGQLQAMQKVLAELSKQAAEQKIKLVGKDQMRDIDAYDAETRRIVGMGNSVKDLGPAIAPLVHQLVLQSLQTTLGPVLAASAQTMSTDDQLALPQPSPAAQPPQQTGPQ